MGNKTLTPVIQPCKNSKGWCVHSMDGVSGPIETELEARRYAALVSLVYAARNDTVCSEEVCWQ